MMDASLVNLDETLMADDFRKAEERKIMKNFLKKAACPVEYFVHFSYFPEPITNL